MPTIIFSPSTQLSQVEDFPTDCERTVKGALHVRPGATQTVSDGEVAHLKKCGIAFAVVGALKTMPVPAPVEPPASTLPVVPVPLPSPALTASGAEKGGKGVASKDAASSDKK